MGRSLYKVCSPKEEKPLFESAPEHEAWEGQKIMDDKLGGNYFQAGIRAGRNLKVQMDFRTGGRAHPTFSPGGALRA